MTGISFLDLPAEVRNIVYSYYWRKENSPVPTDHLLVIRERGSRRIARNRRCFLSLAQVHPLIRKEMSAMSWARFVLELSGKNPQKMLGLPDCVKQNVEVLHIGFGSYPGLDLSDFNALHDVVLNSRRYREGKGAYPRLGPLLHDAARVCKILELEIKTKNQNLPYDLITLLRADTGRKYRLILKIYTSRNQFVRVA